VTIQRAVEPCHERCTVRRDVTRCNEALYRFDETLHVQRGVVQVQRDLHDARGVVQVQRDVTRCNEALYRLTGRLHDATRVVRFARRLHVHERCTGSTRRLHSAMRRCTGSTRRLHVQRDVVQVRREFTRCNETLYRSMRKNDSITAVDASLFLLQSVEKGLRCSGVSVRVERPCSKSSSAR